MGIGSFCYFSLAICFIDMTKKWLSIYAVILKGLIYAYLLYEFAEFFYPFWGIT